MKKFLANPRLTAIIGFLLALPFVTILALLMLGIEPSFGPLNAWLNQNDTVQPNILGTLMVSGAFLLSILGWMIVRMPVVYTMSAGGSLLAHPVNLLLAVVILSFILIFIGGIIIDQYPCWIGVPNCD